MSKSQSNGTDVLSRVPFFCPPTALSAIFARAPLCSPMPGLMLRSQQRVTTHVLYTSPETSMSDRIDDLTVDFFQALFGRVFSDPLTGDASSRERRRIQRRVEETADAASKSLSRFLVNRQTPPDVAEVLLDGLSRLGDR